MGHNKYGCFCELLMYNFCSDKGNYVTKFSPDHFLHLLGLLVYSFNSSLSELTDHIACKSFTKIKEELYIEAK